MRMCGLHNTTIKRILSSVLLILLLMCSMAGCGQASQNNTAAGLQLYYITSDIDGLIPVSCDLDMSQYDTTADRVRALTDALSVSPESLLWAPLGPESGYVSVQMMDNQVILDFDQTFSGMDIPVRTLIMAAATRTLTQIDGVDSVSGTIDGAPMLDSMGMVIGPMTADSYLDNAGLQISAEERTQLTLYFADEEGDGLTKVTRTVVYSGNIPMDKLVVMQLISGPQEGENAYPVLSPDTKLINVTTQDGTCYVNLDSSFLSPAYDITNDVAIYSIVDSLIELGTVNKVQFLIDSDSDALFRETVSLHTQFERNLDIVN